MPPSGKKQPLLTGNPIKWACYCRLKRSTSQPGLKLETEDGNLESAMAWNWKSVLLLCHVMSYSVINSVQPSLKSGSGNWTLPLPCFFHSEVSPTSALRGLSSPLDTAESLKASKHPAFGTLRVGVLVKTLQAVTCSFCSSVLLLCTKAE